MTEKSYQQINAEAWNRWVAEGIEWGIPIDHETYLRAKNGDWNVLLTPTKPVPHSWFPALSGARVLGLASAGGQQMPIFSALGAHCTVFDQSKAQLASERMVSEREGYAIDIVSGDMTKPLPFESETFDLIFHPVSNCYIEEVEPVWRECFRVLKHGGVLLAGMDNSLTYLFLDDRTEPLTLYNKLPFNPVRNEEHRRQLETEDCGMQFSHTLTEQLGGQLRAGLVLTDLYEDISPGSILGTYVPEFYATRAVKP